MIIINLLRFVRKECAVISGIRLTREKIFIISAEGDSDIHRAVKVIGDR